MTEPRDSESLRGDAGWGEERAGTPAAPAYTRPATPRRALATPRPPNPGWPPAPASDNGKPGMFAAPPLEPATQGGPYRRPPAPAPVIAGTTVAARPVAPPPVAHAPVQARPQEPVFAPPPAPVAPPLARVVAPPAAPVAVAAPAVAAAPPPVRPPMPVPVPAPLLDEKTRGSRTVWRPKRSSPPVLTAPDGSGPDGPGPVEQAEDDRPPRSFLRELPILIAVAVVLAIVIKTFLLQAFFIPSGSMENTLLVGDRVLVNKLVYDFRDPHRGEIVVFNGLKSCDGTPAGPPAKTCAWPQVPATEGTSGASNALSSLLRKLQSIVGLGSTGDHDFIKRVIAVGGDTVSCPAEAGNPDYCDKVVVDGVPLDETGYVFEDNHAVFAPVKVPKGDLWVMGDHRGDSSDSRYNGTIAVSSVVGRAFVTVWPLGRFGGHEVPKDFQTKFPQQAAAAAALPPVAGVVGAFPLTWAGRRIRSRRRSRRA